MQETLYIAKKKVVVKARKITRHCNFAGWAVFIDGVKYKFFCLTAKKAIDHALTKHFLGI